MDEPAKPLSPVVHFGILEARTSSSSGIYFALFELFRGGQILLLHGCTLRSLCFLWNENNKTIVSLCGGGKAAKISYDLCLSAMHRFVKSNNSLRLDGGGDSSFKFLIFLTGCFQLEVQV